MENPSASINLIKKETESSFDKFIDWALSIGRLIVIITEIIAIGAFIYRFSLDERLIQLHAEIKQKQNSLASLKKDEENFRNLQGRLSLASNLSKNGASVYNTFQDIVELTPEDLNFNDLTLSKDRVVINLDVISISSLNVFVNSLKAYPNIKSLSIDKIENVPNVGISVAITGLLK